MILPRVRDPRLVTTRRGGSLTDDDHRLLALWAATSHRERPRTLTLACTVAASLAALLSKETGVAVVAAGRGGSLGPSYDDRRDVRLPADRPVSAEDLRDLRFNTVLRGYRPSEVDALLDRLVLGGTPVTPQALEALATEVRRTARDRRTSPTPRQETA